jgi:hypothetical protein
LVPASLDHPIFEAVRPWFERLRSPRCDLHEGLNALAEQAALRTESGLAVRFVPPARDAPRPYELRVFETGRVETRPDNLHDLFNALAWLAFPRTKARINAMHAAAIPAEAGRRGPLRDLLTIFDEGGLIAVCGDPQLEALIRQCRWKELFWERRAALAQGLRFIVLGHAVLEQALAPWPGITCKALFVAPDADPDTQASAWLAAVPPGATPRLLPGVPVLGYPGWHAAGARAAFYDDARYFRPAPAARYGNAGKRES